MDKTKTASEIVCDLLQVGQSREQIAAEIGVRSETVDKWRKGKNEPLIPCMRALEKLYAQYVRGA